MSDEQRAIIQKQFEMKRQLSTMEFGPDRITDQMQGFSQQWIYTVVGDENGRLSLETVDAYNSKALWRVALTSNELKIDKGRIMLIYQRAPAEASP